MVAFRLLGKFRRGSSCCAEVASDSQSSVPISLPLKDHVWMSCVSYSEQISCFTFGKEGPSCHKMKGLTPSWSLGLVQLPFLMSMFVRYGISQTSRPSSSLTCHHRACKPARAMANPRQRAGMGQGEQAQQQSWPRQVTIQGSKATCKLPVLHAERL